MNIGDKISWRGVNRTETGIVEQIASIVTEEGTKKMYEVRMDDGKYMIVDEKSII